MKTVTLTLSLNKDAITALKAALDCSESEYLDEVRKAVNDGCGDIKETRELYGTVSADQILEVKRLQYNGQSERVFRFYDFDGDEYWAVGYGSDYHCANESELKDIENNTMDISHIEASLFIADHYCCKVELYSDSVSIATY